MNRRWRSGQSAKFWTWLALGFLILAGIGTLFGLRLRAIAIAASEVRNLREEQNQLWTDIEGLQASIQRARDPKVIEEKAREILRFAYPDEDLVILIRKR